MKNYQDRYTTIIAFIFLHLMGTMMAAAPSASKRSVGRILSHSASLHHASSETTHKKQPEIRIVAQWSLNGPSQTHNKKPKSPRHPLAMSTKNPLEYYEIAPIHQALYLLPFQETTAADIMHLLNQPRTSQEHTTLVNIRDRENNTPLHLLAMASIFDTFGKNSSRTMPDLETYELTVRMIELGAHVDAPGQHDDRPLFIAAGNIQDEPDMVHLLLVHGANPNAQSTDGETPLFKATRRGAPRIAEVLLKAGANANAQNRHGQTPLHILLYEYYARHDDQEYEHARTMRRILIKHGAQPDLRDTQGLTPIDIEKEAIRNFKTGYIQRKIS